jgi:outer membrane receptor protein involved in Fe transport
MDGDTGALGFFTAPSDPARVDRSRPDTRSDARRRTLALFAREAWKPLPKWGLTAGVRFDSDRFGYDERIPDPSNDDSRSFSEVSLSAGVTWQPRDEAGFYLSYGEAFLPPTIEQLFAFPGFGSNPGLVPQDSRSLQAGTRVAHTWADRSLDLDAAIFRVATDDEIVFRPGPLPGAPFGRNENQGSTLRRGVELSVRSRLAPRIAGFINAAWTDAQFRNGPNQGHTVPLVPRNQISAGMDLTLPAGLALRAEALRVGDQVLDNDDANEQGRLSSYATANLRIAWKPAAAQGKPGDSAGGDARGPSFLVEAKNLLDRKYATRGIYAFDYGSSRSAAFLTPAPGRRYLAGGEWKF